MAGWSTYDLGSCCCPSTCAPTKICVQGCNLAHVLGAGVVLKQAGATIGSGTTGADGCCLIAIPASGTYEVITTAAGYLLDDETRSLTCAGTFVVTLSVDDDHVCCTQCPVPIPKTLHLSDGGGGCTLTYGNAAPGCGEWGGCYVLGTGPSYDPCQCGQPDPPPLPGGSSCDINYCLRCIGGTWSLSRGWATCSSGFATIICAYCSSGYEADCSRHSVTCPPDNVATNCGFAGSDFASGFSVACDPFAVTLAMTLGTGCGGSLSSPLGSGVSISA